MKVIISHVQRVQMSRDVPKETHSSRQLCRIVSLVRPKRGVVVFVECTTIVVYEISGGGPKLISS